MVNAEQKKESSNLFISHLHQYFPFPTKKKNAFSFNFYSIKYSSSFSPCSHFSFINFSSFPHPPLFPFPTPQPPILPFPFSITLLPLSRAVLLTLSSITFLLSLPGREDITEEGREDRDPCKRRREVFRSPPPPSSALPPLLPLPPSNLRTCRRCGQKKSEQSK